MPESVSVKIGIKTHSDCIKKQTFRILESTETAIIQEWSYRKLAYSVASIKGLNLVKSKTYGKKKFFPSMAVSENVKSGHTVHSDSRRAQYRNICVSRWTIWMCNRSWTLFETSFSIHSRRSKNMRHC